MKELLKTSQKNQPCSNPAIVIRHIVKFFFECMEKSTCEHLYQKKTNPRNLSINPR
jgi:hypothetical protein